jgi:hypothetical protein
MPSRTVHRLRGHARRDHRGTRTSGASVLSAGGREITNFLSVPAKWPSTRRWGTGAVTSCSLSTTGRAYCGSTQSAVTHSASDPSPDTARRASPEVEIGCTRWPPEQHRPRLPQLRVPRKMRSSRALPSPYLSVESRLAGGRTVRSPQPSGQFRRPRTIYQLMRISQYRHSIDCGWSDCAVHSIEPPAVARLREQCVQYQLDRRNALELETVSPRTPA